MGELVPVNPSRPQILLPDTSIAARMAGSFDAGSLLAVYGRVLDKATNTFYKVSTKPGSGVLGYYRSLFGGESGSTTTMVCLPHYEPEHHLFLLSWEAYRLRTYRSLDITQEEVVASLVPAKYVYLPSLRAHPEKWFEDEVGFTSHGLGLRRVDALANWWFQFERGRLSRFSHQDRLANQGLTIDFGRMELHAEGAGFGGLAARRYDISEEQLFMDGTAVTETLTEVVLRSLGNLPREGLLIPQASITQRLVRFARRVLRE